MSNPSNPYRVPLISPLFPPLLLEYTDSYAHRKLWNLCTLPEPLSNALQLIISHVIALDAIEEVCKLHDVFIPSDKAEFWKEYSEKADLCGKKASLALFVASGDH